MKLHCPDCGHVIGATLSSFDGNINCRWCRKSVDFKVIIAKSADYLPERKLNDN